MFSIVRATSGAFRLADDLYIVPCNASGSVASARLQGGEWILAHTFYGCASGVATILVYASHRRVHVYVGGHGVSVRITRDAIADAGDGYEKYELPVLVCLIASLAASVHDAVERGDFNPQEYEPAENEQEAALRYRVRIDGLTVKVC